MWNLRRTLIRGVTGGSDPRLTDECGQEHNLGDIIPQLDSLDAGEGVHIIFAPQTARLRRQSEDLSAFERTVFNHLGIAHPRDLLSQMENFLVSQSLVEDDVGQELTGVRDRIDKRIVDLESQRGTILSATALGWTQITYDCSIRKQGKTTN